MTFARSRPMVPVAALAVATLSGFAAPAFAGPAFADDGLLHPGFDIVAGQTALLVTYPQNDFLSPDGVAWGVVGANVEANGAVENIDTLFATAKATGMPVFISPHYYFPHITCGTSKAYWKL